MGKVLRCYKVKSSMTLADFFMANDLELSFLSTSNKISLCECYCMNTNSNFSLLEYIKKHFIYHFIVTQKSISSAMSDVYRLNYIMQNTLSSKEMTAITRNDIVFFCQYC